MTRFATWVGKNADAVIALVIAITAAVLGLGLNLPNEEEITNSAVLAVVGLLATSILRERTKREPVEAAVQESLTDVRAKLRAHAYFPSSSTSSIRSSTASGATVRCSSFNSGLRASSTPSLCAILPGTT